VLPELFQEVKELGARGTAFRLSWEARKRWGALDALDALLEPTGWVTSGQWATRLPFADPATVVDALRGRVPLEHLAALQERALAATRGRIRCFGRWVGDFGDPVDWHLNPTNGQRWKPDVPWSRVLEDERRVGDVKLTWELGRFPHAFELARAAAFKPAQTADFSAALLRQLEAFTAQNPRGLGVHWASGQETAIRLFAWLFAHDVLLSRGPDRERAGAVVANALQVGAAHIAQHLEYAREAVFNNHVLYEALGLYAAGVLLGHAPWRTVGRDLLIAECDRQFYDDGAYIQQSHNYHRVALQCLLLACVFATAGGEAPDEAWLRALDRSLHFLVQHQNPGDGRLPNYGGNDGALPLLLSTCDFSDFRPVLQAVSVLVRGQRLYEPGPWDEPAAWLFGARVLDLPVQQPRRRSVSFGPTGYHVLRGQDEGSFAAFRCGSLRDRFSQIDMLHLDVWWRGLNVLVDPGSYLYNGAAEWHDHFIETASHNTVVVDERDQMLHHRRFKTLYWTRARLLGFADGVDHATCAGEHFGYQRHQGGVVHRRSVLFLKDDLWVVVDHLRGTGSHRARLHWLAGFAEVSYSADEGRLRLDTPSGLFSLAVSDELARPLVGTVVSGSEHPPRGWLSRSYAERQPVASLAVEREVALPTTLVTVMGAGTPTLHHDGARLSVRQDSRTIALRLEEGVVSLAEEA